MLFRERLKAWIIETINTGGFHRFDDLHVDQLSSEYREPRTWLLAAKEVATVLRELRHEIPMGFCTAVGMSLNSSDTRLGVTFQTAAELASEFMLTPPSVYVFARGAEPWTLRPNDSQVVSSDLLSIRIEGIQCIHFEYREPYESTYRRSFWVVC